MNTPARKTRPCSYEVVITATGEHGVALCQWIDGEYAVRLDDTGALVDVDPSQLLFISNTPGVIA